MKKRYKIFISIACMVLTFALLGYGVYAATSVTFSLGASLSFTPAVPDSDLLFSYSATAKRGTTTASFNTQLSSNTASNSASSPNLTWNIGTLMLTGVEPYLQIRIVFTNDSDNAITITPPSKPSDPNGFRINSWSTSTMSLASGNVATWSAVIVITTTTGLTADLSSSISSGNFSLAFA